MHELQIKDKSGENLICTTIIANLRTNGENQIFNHLGWPIVPFEPSEISNGLIEQWNRI